MCQEISVCFSPTVRNILGLRSFVALATGRKALAEKKKGNFKKSIAKRDVVQKRRAKRVCIVVNITHSAASFLGWMIKRGCGYVALLCGGKSLKQKQINKLLKEKKTATGRLAIGIVPDLCRFQVLVRLFGWESKSS